MPALVSSHTLSDFFKQTLTMQKLLIRMNNITNYKKNNDELN